MRDSLYFIKSKFNDLSPKKRLGIVSALTATAVMLGAYALSSDNNEDYVYLVDLANKYEDDATLVDENGEAINVDTEDNSNLLAIVGTKKTKKDKKGKKMGNIVIIEGKNKYCFRNLEEIIKQFLGKDFYNLSKEEQYKKIRMKTVMNSTFRKIPIKDLKKGETVTDVSKEQYIIYDEEILLLSLAKNNDIVIYEKENANIFVKNIDKNKLEKFKNEYIIVNYCANELIENKLRKENLL